MRVVMLVTAVMLSLAAGAIIALALPPWPAFNCGGASSGLGCCPAASIPKSRSKLERLVTEYPLTCDKDVTTVTT